MADVKVPMLGKTTKASLPAGVFEEAFNESLVHEAARADLNAQRQGTASSLTRGEVAMTGAKAWKQKGTGRARIGAQSVPHRRGGGAAFGPKPRHYTFKVNRKARRKALRSALSVHAARGSIAVLPAGSFAEPATKEAAAQLAKWAPKLPVLVVLTEDDLGAAKSFRNIPRVRVSPADAIGVADVIGSRSLLVSEAALETLEVRTASEVTRTGSAGESAAAAPAVSAAPAAASAAEDAGAGGEEEE